MNFQVTLVSSALVCIPLLSEASLLFWSNQKLSISPLQPFGDDALRDLIEDLGYPEVSLYKSTVLLPEFKEIIEGFHTAYSPNGDINPENATDISDEDNIELLNLKQKSGDSEKSNTLSILIIPNNRDKRQAPPISTNSNMTESPKGPVMYISEKSKKDTYGLLYSSLPLLLKVNSTNLYLGKTDRDMINVDTTNKDSFTRLNIVIPIEGNNVITLRFVFAWSVGYWHITSVKVIDRNGNYSFNLTANINKVPAHFSYHCTGETVFSDSSQAADLYLYDMQVQIDATRERFDDAYDCVDFTTTPIWSGLFVTAILGIGLIIALNMINNIKTMDKFDNQKTKQLSITLSE